METKSISMARFDTRLPKDQKDFFEYAASLGGFRTLTEFLISAAQEKANTIVQAQRILLSSKEDREIFFNAIMNPPKANAKLKTAAKRYKSAIRQ
ncbi:MAG: DUF1778 domain-containing protein [Bacteroidetes bacterium]|nr:DUF1778 domain-containing protein [Bacteroidota bacterium]